MCSIGIPNSMNAACERQFTQWTRCLAPFRLFRHIQFDNIVAMPPKLIALGSNDHIGSGWSRAGGGSPRQSIDFTDTEPTGTEGSEVMRDAEARDRDPGFLGSLVDRVTG
jgi:hypothetical protein